MRNESRWAGADWRTWALTYFYFIIFGGFVLPPALGLFVRMNGEPGYAQGFYMFLGLAVSALILFTILKRSTAAALP